MYSDPSLTQETYPHAHTHTKDNNLQVNLKRIANEVLTCERQPLQEGRHHGDEDANHQVVLE